MSFLSFLSYNFEQDKTQFFFSKQYFIEKVKQKLGSEANSQIYSSIIARVIFRLGNCYFTGMMNFFFSNPYSKYLPKDLEIEAITNTTIGLSKLTKGEFEKILEQEIEVEYIGIMIKSNYVSKEIENIIYEIKPLNVIRQEGIRKRYAERMKEREQEEKQKEHEREARFKKFTTIEKNTFFSILETKYQISIIDVIRNDLDTLRKVQIVVDVYSKK